ncbi:unnamed protein product [Didymodactylos carnosus]|uniref:Retrotransposon gag domain-containing protein n=1 Tax=Didymodactylos carnosus TaxID=1234261 RepID=A0A815C330_9BILA|nr:unnamed protein product [Didymodactylos carnosus]CAF1275104.1 unnamed protein product [Didymodactylos carnosus]CAF3853260.1 unnamed protein product [Didymodactylos carnosus]CAF4065851.1 unnamed protein product [Didymodactylos carnosus]
MRPTSRREETSTRSVQGAEPFSGADDQDPTDWLDKIETILAIANVKDDARTPITAQCLSGDAAKWYNDKITKRSNGVHEPHHTKSQLLDIAFNNLPPKQYLVDEAAKKFGVIEQFCKEYMTSCGSENAADDFRHCPKYENQFKVADSYAEKLEEELIHDEDDIQEDVEISEEDEAKKLNLQG